MNEVEKCNFSKKQTSVGFDVVSLFTNMSLSKTIKLNFVYLYTVESG